MTTTILLTVAILAADWSRFRGPNGSGVAESPAPAQFSPRENVVWNLDLPPGHSSPVLARDKVILVCDQGVGSFIIAVDKNNGRVRWKTPRPRAVSGHSTPVLYEPENAPAQILAPGSFELASYSAETGEKLWWIDGLPGEMKSVPVIGGDTVYVCGYNIPENDPGKQVKIAHFDEA